MDGFRFAWQNSSESIYKHDDNHDDDDDGDNDDDENHNYWREKKTDRNSKHIYVVRIQ